MLARVLSSEASDIGPLAKRAEPLTVVTAAGSNFATGRFRLTILELTRDDGAERFRKHLGVWAVVSYDEGGGDDYGRSDDPAKSDSAWRLPDEKLGFVWVEDRPRRWAGGDEGKHVLVGSTRDVSKGPAQALACRAQGVEEREVLIALGQSCGDRHQLVETDGPSPWGREGDGNSGDQRLGEDRGALDAVRQWVDSAADDRGGELAVGELSHSLLFGKADEIDSQIRPAPVGFFEYQGEQIAEARAGSDPERRVSRPGVPRCLAGAIDGSDDPASMVEERCTGGGELDPAGGAEEQLSTELAFESADLLADCRLNDVKLFSGMSEVPKLGYGEKTANLANLHSSPH